MKKVLLVHGFLMHPIVMSLFAKRFKEAGYHVDHFGYPAFPTHDQLSKDFLSKVETTKPDAIIGHSLGGNIILRQLTNLDPSVSKVVCLGSPLRGSSVARKVEESVLSVFLSDAAKELLLEEIVIPKSSISVGVVAGTCDNFGFNILFKVFATKNDGTVSVEETTVSGITEHVEVYAGHTGLIFSESVAKQTVNFLETGSFVC